MLLSHTDSGSKVGSSFSSSTSEARQEIIGIHVPNHSASTRGGLDQLQLDWCEAFVGLTSECTVTCTAAAATLTLILINRGFVSNRIWLLVFVMPLVCSKQRQRWRTLLQEQRVGGRSILIVKKLLGLQSYNQVRVKFECVPTSLLFCFYRCVIAIICLIPNMRKNLPFQKRKVIEYWHLSQVCRTPPFICSFHLLIPLNGCLVFILIQKCGRSDKASLFYP